MLKRIICTNPMSISLVFIGLMFSIPFISMHHEQPLTAFYNEWLAGLFGLLAIFPFLNSVLSQTPQKLSVKSIPIVLQLKTPQISLIFLGLGLILCLQWMLGMLHSSQYAASVLSYFIWAFLLLALGSHLRREIGLEKLVTMLAWGLIIAGIFNILIVVLQFVMRTGGNIPFMPNLSSYGTLSQPNHFADFCALSTASLIYLYAKGNFSSSFFRLLLVCFIVLLSLSGSRSVWLYLTVFTVLITLLHFNMMKQGTQTERSIGAWRAGLILLPAFILIQLFIFYLTPNDLANLPTERLINGITERTSSTRLQFWYDSWRMFLQSPWLGVGVGKFTSNTFLLIDTPTAMASKRVFEHAHNLFLHLLAEMGLGAFLIVAIGSFSWIKAFKWQDLNLETWWIISLLAILGIHSMLEYPLWYTFFLGIAAVLLGAGDEKHITINLSKSAIKLTRFSLISLWILGAANITTLLISNIKLENWIQKFASENVNDLAQLNWVQQYSLLSPYSELMLAGSIDINNNLINEQFLLSQSVMNFKPMRTIAYQHALLLELKGRHEEAVKQLDRTLKAFPNTFKKFLENPELTHRQEYLNLYSETETARLNK